MIKIITNTLIILTLLLSSTITSFAHLPEGFSDQLIWKGTTDDQPLGMIFDADGRMYFWKKNGTIYLVEPDGTFQETPVLDISEEVGNYGDHGFLSMTLDPNFEENGYIYMIYNVDRHHLLYYGTPEYDPDILTKSEATIGRVARWQLDINNDFKSAVPDSRFILIGESLETGIPVLHESHGPDCVAFGTDGSLLVSAGDGTTFEGTFTGTGSTEPPSYVAQGLEDGIVDVDEDIGAYRSQYPHSHNGKIMRIDPMTGDGLPSNPYYDPANPRSPISRMWALGFRNPYKMIVRPNSGSTDMADGNPGAIYVGDVGSFSFEELNVVTAGGQNFGWPIYESYFAHPYFSWVVVDNLATPNPLYGQEGCDQEYISFNRLIAYPSTHEIIFENPCDDTVEIPEEYPTFVLEWPMLAYSNAFWNTPTQAMIALYEDGSCEPSFYSIEEEESPVSGENFGGYSSIPGFFYTNTVNNFPEEYHGKYFHGDYSGWLRVFDIDENNQLHRVDNFLLEEGRNITSFVLNPADGCVYYTDLPNAEIRKIGYQLPQPPSIVLNYDKNYGVAPLEVEFTADQSFHPNDLDFDYLWEFGDGTTSTEMNPSHIFDADSDAPQSYTVSLTLTDSDGLSNTEEMIVSVNNTPPEIAISSFESGYKYSIYTSTFLPLIGDVVDAEHSLDELTFRWQTVLHHNSHTHSEAIVNDMESEARIEPYGCQGELYYYSISLRVTDPEGLESFVQHYLYPECGDSYFQWESFTATPSEEGVTLEWSTDIDMDGTTFVVQRKRKGERYYNDEKFMENVSGNSFSYFDDLPIFGESIYTLRTVLPDSTIVFSDEVSVLYPLGESVLVYPNPTDGQLFFNLATIDPDADVKFYLYNIYGELILFNELSGSCNHTTTSIENFSEGTYIYRILIDGKEQTGKIVKAP